MRCYSPRHWLRRTQPLPVPTWYHWLALLACIMTLLVVWYAFKQAGTIHPELFTN